MTEAALTTQHPAQAVDDIATRILAFVEEMLPINSPSGPLGAEALLAALARRLGPIDYASFLASIPVNRLQ